MTDLHRIASSDAECALLRAILADPDQLDQLVADGLRAQDLSVQLHRHG